MSISVYVYNNTHTVIVNTSANQGNVTMYDKTIKLYQGIDNTVKFELKDSDRAPVNLTNMTVTINIIDSKNFKNKLKKLKNFYYQKKCSKKSIDLIYKLLS